MRVGIICTPSIQDERDKSELVEIDLKMRPWLKNIAQEDVIVDEQKLHTSDDRSIAYYLKSVAPSSYDINIIIPTDKSAIAKAKANDINFLLIFDVLEAFYVLPWKKFKQVQVLFELDNVFPSYEFQHFVNHKNVYYDYFRSKGVNVLPNLHISKKEFEDDPDAVVEKVLGMQKGDDGMIICKPVYGQESIGFHKLSDPINADKLERLMEMSFQTYKGLLFQPYVEDLSRNIEYRIMFVGNRPVFGVRTGGDMYPDYFEPSEEPKVVAFSKHVVKMLPPNLYKGILCPRLLTRVDVGCCFGKGDYFVSEIEFVPSLFIPESPETLKFDAILGNQIIHIIRFLESKAVSTKEAGMNKTVTAVLVLVLITVAVIAIASHLADK
jgi:hypothetical protein